MRKLLIPLLFLPAAALAQSPCARGPNEACSAAILSARTNELALENQVLAAKLTADDAALANLRAWVKAYFAKPKPAVKEGSPRGR